MNAGLQAGQVVPSDAARATIDKIQEQLREADQDRVMLRINLIPKTVGEITDETVLLMLKHLVYMSLTTVEARSM